MISLYGHKRPYDGLYNVVTNGFACHMCLLGSNLNAHVKLEKQAIQDVHIYKKCTNDITIPGGCL